MKHTWNTQKSKADDVSTANPTREFDRRADLTPAEAEVAKRFVTPSKSLGEAGKKKIVDGKRCLTRDAPLHPLDRAPTTTKTTPTPPNGCATSSRPGTCPKATWMSDPSSMFGRTICEAIPSIISSVGSADGRSRSGKPDGPTTAPHGQALAPAKAFPPPEPEGVSTIPATSGRSGTISSASAALNESLGNKLRARLPLVGSILYSETWRENATPAGRRYWAHTASALRTSGSDFTGWPTPCASEQNSTPEAWERMNSAAKARNPRLGKKQKMLSTVAQLTGWGTPTARDNYKGKGLENWRLGNQARLVSGAIATGSPAATEKAARLSPEHSRWLMGIPATWGSCAPTETPSFRRKLKSSLKRSWIRGSEIMTSPAVLLKEVEAYLRRYVAFSNDAYAFPLALWLAGTHVYDNFDAYGYLVITAATKRAGKTRLMELLSFVAARARHVADITPAAMFGMIENEQPSLMIDEAERFAASQQEFRAIINSGYRRGGEVTRRQGQDIRRYRVYCPKVFVLIGDPNDTLRDRSIVINLRRAHSPYRSTYSGTQAEGKVLRDKLVEMLATHSEQIADAYVDLGRFDFLSDREEEIWSPLFSICRVLCPDRWGELVRAAVDISTAKTAEARKFTDLQQHEDAAQQIEYGERVLRDLIQIIESKRKKSISTAEAIIALRELPTGPWRAFRGAGLEPGIEGSMMLASLLERFGVRPRTIRLRPKSQGAKGSTVKGYVLEDLKQAWQKAGLLS
jgi:Protein of unknown function (DUF3631)